MKSLVNKYYLVFLVIVFSALSYKFYFVCDDAYISFQYSKNLASGYGLVFNRGLEPVEGYTNFLWVLVASFFYYIKLPIIIVMPIISSLFAILYIVFINKVIVKRYSLSNKTSFLTILFSITLFPSFFIWSTSGMETMPYSVLIFLLFYYLVLDSGKKEKLILLISLSLSLIRFEGIFIAIFIYALTIFHKNFNKKLIFRFLILYCTYFLFRFLYFGDLFPNTIYMKVGASWALIKRGLNYNILYLLTEPFSVLSFLGLVIMLVKKVKYSVEYCILYIALFLYPIVVGGDFLPYFRFLMPFCICQVVPVAFFIDSLKKRMCIFIPACFSLMSFFSVYNVSVFGRDFLSKFHFRFNTSQFRTEIESYDYLNDNNYKRELIYKTLTRLSKNERERGQLPSAVVGGIGLIAFYSDLIIYDIYGLVNKDLRNIKVTNLRSPGHDKRVKPSYFLKYKPLFVEIFLNVNNRRLDWYQNKILNNNKNNIYKDYDMLNVPTDDKDITLLVLKRKNT